MRINDAVCGRIGTHCIPTEIDALPAMTEERSLAVRQWYSNQYERAYAAIIAEYPEAAAGRRDAGEIEVWLTVNPSNTGSVNG